MAGRRGRRERGDDAAGASEAGTPGPDADPEAIARQICLRMLTAAPRTKAQLAAALHRRGVPDEAAAAVLDRFTEVNLIDDGLFASAWVESRHHGRGLASRALGAELRQRGVAHDDIAAALSKLGPEQELATARELVARRLTGTAGQPLPVRMRKLTGVLARKGYPAGLAYRVVREALEAERQGGSSNLGSAGLASASVDSASVDSASLDSASLDSAGLDSAGLDSASLDSASLDEDGDWLEAQELDGEAL